MHENAIKFLCSLCNFKSSCNKSLLNHVAEHHGTVKKISCSICDHVFAHEDELDTHTLEYHGVVTCELCCYVAKHKSRVKRHFLATHKNSHFVCRRCTRNSSSKHVQAPTFRDFLQQNEKPDVLECGPSMIKHEPPTTNDQEQKSDGDEEENEDSETLYCLCRKVWGGEDMVGCDNKSCVIEWFHFKCVGVTSKPRGKWFCPNCRGSKASVMRSTT